MSYTSDGLVILIVEDCPDTAASLAMLLSGEGHSPHIARTGPEALAIASEFPPDVAFLDVGLPGMDGWAVAKQLGEQAGERLPLLVAVTGYGTATDRCRSAEVGVHLHLVKPVDPVKLFQILERFARVLHPPIAVPV